MQDKFLLKMKMKKNQKHVKLRIYMKLNISIFESIKL
jgi:hypothetical protein